ncbi:MAG: aminotransferase class I/II-fold pyridoxal phosphate-dependent enzyme [Proteobacteria bacterium]|nr:aminotransferase class I/II-fold pyridoxal phosphate-dependent enzyme [Pseudomonadota bacterium]
MTSLSQADPTLAALIARDAQRQRSHIQLIASENFVSYAMMEASGSVLANKYSEGYPGRRYYEGCEVIDEIETLAIDRAKSVFGSEHANVQPHSGSQANMAAYLAVLEPGDTILGMRLDQGGHLTHGSPVNFSGQLFNFIAYGLDETTERIDMEQVRSLALEHKPKMIVAGYSSYSRIIDWSEFRAIADEVGAIFLVDAAHIIGLIAGDAHPSPVPHADIVTATTHKALRGPRGGLILSTQEHAKAIDKAVFPTSQGGAINHQIAGKALCFKQAASPEFADYARQIVRNASVLADTMIGAGSRVISGGTENHMFLVDLRSIDEDLTGKEAATLLDDMGVTLNRNAIPFDPRSPFITSGIRMGTAAVTTAGMKQEQMVTLGSAIVEILRKRNDDAVLKQLGGVISELADDFPSYPVEFNGYV